MSMRAVIFGPRSEEYIRDFVALPKRIYVKEELMQNEKEERAILKGTHVLSRYFTVTPILVYEDERAVSRGIVTVYPDDDVAYFGFLRVRITVLPQGCCSTRLLDWCGIWDYRG